MKPGRVCDVARHGDWWHVLRATVWWGNCCPLLPGRWSNPERRLAAAVGSAADRLLSHGHVEPVDVASVEKELESRRVNYAGEEVGKCHSLTMDQVRPALPPKEHGGSIDVTKFLSSSSCDFLNLIKQWLMMWGKICPSCKGRFMQIQRRWSILQTNLCKEGFVHGYL